MRLHFYGTKGYVEEESAEHRGHSAFTITVRGFRLLCDFGQSHEGSLHRIQADAIFVSHAHPDHAGGLKEGTDVPVYASEVTHEITKDFAISRREVVEPRRPAKIGPFRVTTYPVVHSIRCPCVASRIEGPEGSIVYSGDIVAFEDPAEALSRADTYVGDGSTLKRSLVRRHPSGVLIGHTTVRAQLGWLAKSKVPRAIFSHFGKGPIEMGEPALKTALADLASEKAPQCRVTAARDGLRLEL